MTEKDPKTLWNLIFNIPQGMTMTVAVSLFMGRADAVSLCQTFVCAYCAGVMLTLLLPISAFAGWVARLLRCKKPLPTYLVSAAAAGVLMGVFMNLFITFMLMGPVPAFPAAFLHTLLFSIVVSAVSSCLWSALADAIVARICGKRDDEPETVGGKADDT